MAKPAHTDQIDQRLGQYGNRVTLAQANYRTAKARFAQGLPTHSTIPADGAATPADRFSHRPTDQAESWEDLSTGYNLPFPSPNLGSVQVDTYDGPRGQGYVMTVLTVGEGRVWQKCINVGPETERNRDWTHLGPLSEFTS